MSIMTPFLWHWETKRVVSFKKYEGDNHVLTLNEISGVVFFFPSSTTVFSFPKMLA